MKTGRADYDDKILSLGSAKELISCIATLKGHGGMLLDQALMNLADAMEANLASGPIPPDEPVFLMRGQDPYAPRGIKNYTIAVSANRNEPVEPVVTSALRQASAMESWKVKKTPDLPKESS